MLPGLLTRDTDAVQCSLPGRAKHSMNGTCSLTVASIWQRRQLATASRRLPGHARRPPERWLLTENTYEQQNPKRLYYLSMKFLSAAHWQATLPNLLLFPLRTRSSRTGNSTLSTYWSRSPMQVLVLDSNDSNRTPSASNIRSSIMVRSIFPEWKRRASGTAQPVS